MDLACTSDRGPVPSRGLACLPDLAGDLVDPDRGQGSVFLTHSPGLSIGQADLPPQCPKIKHTTPGKEEEKPQQETGKD